jgi:hypothetical protein
LRVLPRTRPLAPLISPGEAELTEQKMQHLLTKLAAAAIVVGAAIGADQAQAGPLSNLKPTGLASEATPIEKAGYYRYRYGGYYPYRHWRPYPYYRPYYAYPYRPYYWRYGYWNRPYYRRWC